MAGKCSTRARGGEVVGGAVRGDCSDSSALWLQCIQFYMQMILIPVDWTQRLDTPAAGSRRRAP